jgi:Zn-dependent peptidase ImmA (M78 family)
MAEPDFRKAEAAARKVLRDSHITRPPIVPREIAESYGLRVQVVILPEHLQQVAGFIDFSDRTIFVNESDHYNRQTFTIAHEIGHFLLHKDLFDQHPEKYNVLLREPIGAATDPIEKEANAFAADLLVPLDLLNLYRKYATEDELAKLFAVSKEVIGYRLKFASKIPA